MNLLFLTPFADEFLVENIDQTEGEDIVIFSAIPFLITIGNCNLIMPVPDRKHGIRIPDVEPKPLPYS